MYGELTSQMLAFGRRRSLQPRTISVSEHLKSIMRLAHVSLPDNVESTFHFPCDPYFVVVDPPKFESAIMNLIFNARDAMPVGGKIQVLTVPAKEEDGVWSLMSEGNESSSEQSNCILIEVTDSGIGMAPEVAARAFEPFFTTKSIGSGTGMGMAMVHGFVTQSGGYIKIITAPALGTTVRLFLPRSEHAAHYQSMHCYTGTFQVQRSSEYSSRGG